MAIYITDQGTGAFHGNPVTVNRPTHHFITKSNRHHIRIKRRLLTDVQNIRYDNTDKRLAGFTGKSRHLIILIFRDIFRNFFFGRNTRAFILFVFLFLGFGRRFYFNKRETIANLFVLRLTLLLFGETLTFLNIFLVGALRNLIRIRDAILHFLYRVVHLLCGVRLLLRFFVLFREVCLFHDLKRFFVLRLKVLGHVICV